MTTFVRTLIVLAGLVVIANLAVWIALGGVQHRTPSANDLGLLPAAYEGKADQVDRLLAQGANPNVRDHYGNTPLIRCVSWEQYDAFRSETGWISIARDLIAHGADVNHRNSGGMTALMIAAGWDHHGTFDGLLTAGADVNLRDNKGRTALTWAGRSYHGRNLFIQPLLDKGARLGVTEALLIGDVSKARELIESGGDLSVPGGYEDTPLMIAAEWGSLECVKALLRRKVDVNARDVKGYTALMLAAAGRPHLGTQVGWYREDHGVVNGRGAIIRALVAAGADVNARSLGDDPWTALSLAKEAGNHETYAALLALGAKPERDARPY